ncbi:hypothetical protein HDU76_001360 [Blyttiomyces sp. JEL0837]|nr:hypothetical protein HDU76_001360 [Blyttiomyces sp. JEL0837]
MNGASHDDAYGFSNNAFLISQKKRVTGLLLLCIAAVFLSGSPVHADSSKIAIVGGGASFPASVYTSASAQFLNDNQNYLSAVTYNTVNSLDGQNGVANASEPQRYYWGGSDVPLTSQLYPPRGRDVLVLPAVAGGIVVAYNNPNISSPSLPDLYLPRDVLPLIFNGNITFWNDPRIVNANPDLAPRLTGNMINVIVRSPGSGTSINFYNGLKSMYPDLQAFDTSKGFQAFLSNAIVVTQGNAAIGNVVAAVPYTLTYMDAHELQLQVTANKNTPVRSCIVENKLNQKVKFTTNGITIALNAVNASSLTPSTNSSSNQLSSIIDTEADQGYPFALITNFVIRKGGINSSDPADPTTQNMDWELRTRWTLRFLWKLMQYDITVDADNNASFVSINNTPIGDFSYSYLYSYKLNNSDTPLFGQAACDLYANQSQIRPCIHGYCSLRLPFQDPNEGKCICYSGYMNQKYDDCSEAAPSFQLNSIMVKVQVILAGIGIVVLVMVTGLIILFRQHPKIRAIAPSCCFVILIGCAFGVGAILAYAASPTDFTCKVRIIFPTLAFGLVFGMLLLKTYRIYLIFGYTRISSARSLRNWTLINYTMIVVFIDVVLLVLYISLASPQSVQRSFSAQGVSINPQTYLTCAASAGHENLEIIMVSILGAYKRYTESKEIGLVVYVVSLALMLGLPVVYAIPPLDNASLTIVSLVRAGLFLILSAGTALLLFGPRIWEVIEESRSSKDLATSTVGERSDNDPGYKYAGGPSGANGNVLGGIGNAPSWAQESALDNVGYDSVDKPGFSRIVQSMMFEVGVRHNRFGAVWSSTTLLILPELDLIFLMSNMEAGKTTVSFKISTSSAEGLGGGRKSFDSTMPGGSLASPSSDMLKKETVKRNAQNNSNAKNAQTSSNASISGSDSRLITLIPADDRRGYFVEFTSVDKLKAFGQIYESIKARNGSFGMSCIGASGFGDARGGKKPNFITSIRKHLGEPSVASASSSMNGFDEPTEFPRQNMSVAAAVPSNVTDVSPSTANTFSRSYNAGLKQSQSVIIESMAAQPANPTTVFISAVKPPNRNPPGIPTQNTVGNGNGNGTVNSNMSSGNSPGLPPTASSSSQQTTIIPTSPGSMTATPTSPRFATAYSPQIKPMLLTPHPQDVTTVDHPSRSPRFQPAASVSPRSVASQHEFAVSSSSQIRYAELGPSAVPVDSPYTSGLTRQKSQSSLAGDRHY